MLHIFLLAAFTLFVPTLASAEVSYQQMVNIPFVTGNLTIEQYINAIYLLSISIAAVLAVLKITIAGVKYIMSDVVTSKESAKKDIQGALFGLLIVLAAVIILNTINPQLTYFDVLRMGYNSDAPEGNPGGAYTRTPRTVTGSCDSGSRVPRYNIVQGPNGRFRTELGGCLERLPNLNQDQLLVAQRYEAIMAEINGMSAAEQRTADGQARLRQLQRDLNTLIRNGRMGRPVGGGNGGDTGGGETSTNICTGRVPGALVQTGVASGQCQEGTESSLNNNNSAIPSYNCYCPDN